MNRLALTLILLSIQTAFATDYNCYNIKDSECKMLIETDRKDPLVTEWGSCEGDSILYHRHDKVFEDVDYGDNDQDSHFFELSESIITGAPTSGWVKTTKTRDTVVTEQEFLCEVKTPELN